MPAAQTRPKSRTFLSSLRSSSTASCPHYEIAASGCEPLKEALRLSDLCPELQIALFSTGSDDENVDDEDEEVTTAVVSVGAAGAARCERRAPLSSSVPPRRALEPVSQTARLMVMHFQALRDATTAALDPRQYVSAVGGALAAFRASACEPVRQMVEVLTTTSTLTQPARAFAKELLTVVQGRLRDFYQTVEVPRRASELILRMAEADSKGVDPGIDAVFDLWYDEIERQAFDVLDTVLQVLPVKRQRQTILLSILTITRLSEVRAHLPSRPSFYARAKERIVSLVGLPAAIDSLQGLE